MRDWLLDMRNVNGLWALEKRRKFDLYDKICDIHNYNKVGSMEWDVSAWMCGITTVRLKIKLNNDWPFRWKDTITWSMADWLHYKQNFFYVQIILIALSLMISNARSKIKQKMLHKILEASWFRSKREKVYEEASEERHFRSQRAKMAYGNFHYI